MMERLQKYIASSGHASRRAAEDLIKEGRVKVNGEVVIKLGTKIDPEKDEININGKIIEPAEYVYYMLSKPVGFSSAVKDKHEKKLVIGLVPKSPHVFPVGRLDKDSSGLIILTNDGDFAYKMTHPKFEKEKEYEVVCRIMNKEFRINEIIKQFKKGVRLEEGIAKADKIEVLGQKKDIIELKIVIHQGWNRQIRRMCNATRLQVLELKRIRISGLCLGDLAPGKWRKLRNNEIK